MKRYIIGVFDRYHLKNELKVADATNETLALLDVVCDKRKEIKHIVEKLLKDYKTIDELKRYFLDYWGIGVTTPYELKGN